MTKHDDLARLIHEALEQLGWKADASLVADRVKRLDIGLPLEDEFSIICGWLGRCNLIHKLDQQQFPVSSTNDFQVPDLIANFQIDENTNRTFLIEVKSNTKQTLSFRPDYVNKLKKYGEILNLPVLVAWKFYQLWVLVPIDEFRKADKNFNLSITDAIPLSLMIDMLGDFNYVLADNAGLHLRFNKVCLVETKPNEDGREESWNMLLSDVYITNGDGKPIRKYPSIIEQVFHTWDLEYKEEYFDDHIIISYVNTNNDIMSAHMALTRLLAFHTNEDYIHWREHLSDTTVLDNIDNFRGAIEQCLALDVVKFLVDFKPKSDHSLG